MPFLNSAQCLTLGSPAMIDALKHARGSAPILGPFKLPIRPENPIIALDTRGEAKAIDSVLESGI